MSDQGKERDQWPAEVNPIEGERAAGKEVYAFVLGFVFWGLFWLAINHSFSTAVG